MAQPCPLQPAAPKTSSATRSTTGSKPRVTDSALAAGDDGCLAVFDDESRVAALADLGPHAAGGLRERARRGRVIGHTVHRGIDRREDAGVQLRLERVQDVIADDFTLDARGVLA